MQSVKMGPITALWCKWDDQCVIPPGKNHIDHAASAEFNRRLAEVQLDAELAKRNTLPKLALESVKDAWRIFKLSQLGMMGAVKEAWSSPTPAERAFKNRLDYRTHQLAVRIENMIGRSEA